MPDVYNRGFVHLYARYLKVDPQKTMNDYMAFHCGQLTKKQREDIREVAQIPQQVQAPSAECIEMAQKESDQWAILLSEEEPEQKNLSVDLLVKMATILV